jgi:hypothetical protein
LRTYFAFPCSWLSMILKTQSSSNSSQSVTTVQLRLSLVLLSRRPTLNLIDFLPFHCYYWDRDLRWDSFFVDFFDLEARNCLIFGIWGPEPLTNYAVLPLLVLVWLRSFSGGRFQLLCQFRLLSFFKFWLGFILCF